MIFVDSNIPMYLVGAAHPNKQTARRLLERAVAGGDRLVTDAEVFQEILHRYTAIARRDAIAPTFELLSSVVDEVFSIRVEDVRRAKEILLAAAPLLSARDAVHLAVMRQHDVRRVMSFDHGFDGQPALIRIFE